jgi:hypothetical protein
MSERIDFSPATKRIVAARAGYRCSIAASFAATRANTKDIGKSVPTNVPTEAGFEWRKYLNTLILLGVERVKGIEPS